MCREGSISPTRLYVRKIHPDAFLPSYSHELDSGLDLVAVETVEIHPGDWKTIPTGIAIQLPAQTEGEIRPRSGLAKDYGVTVVNSPCTIDNGYRGEIFVILINHGRETFKVEKGMRVAQLIVQRILPVSVVEVETLDETARGVSGFGSSGLFSKT